jgi:LysM repeat protein
MHPRSRTAEVATGVLSAIALLVLVVGIPIVLLRLSAGLVPHQVPSIASLRSALLHRDESGALFVRVLAVLGWAAWVSFAISVVAELIGRARGRRTPRLRGLGAQQRWAGALIAAIVLMFASPAIASAASTPPAIAAAASSRPAAVVMMAPGMATHGPTSGPGSGPESGSGSVAVAAHAVDPSTSPTYQVRRGDYLGVIAKRFEGDFGSYHALASANHITDPNHIEPGWTIALPAGSADSGATPHASGHVTASDPPADSTPVPASPGSAPTGNHSAPPATTPVGAPTTPTPAPTHPASTRPVPTRSAPAHPPAHSTPAHTAPPHSAPAHSSPTHVTTGHGTGQDGSTPGHPGSLVVEMLEASGTLAAVVSLSLLAVKRREQLQRRLVKRVPAPPTGGAIPRLMAPTKQQDVIRLDAALRALAAIVDGWPVERIPQIAGVWMDHATLTLLLADDCGPAPQPFGDDPNGWQLPVDARLPAFDTQLAPLPTLCTVGGRADQHLLLDIEYLRVLGIGGDPVQAMNLLRFLAVELSCNIWSDDVRVVLAGFGDQAKDLAAIDPERMRVQPSIAEAIDRFRHRVACAAAAWDGPAEAPEVLLVANPTADVADNLLALERDLMRAPGLGKAVVIAPTPDGYDASRYQVQVAGDGQLQVGFLGDAIMPAASLPSMLLPEVSLLIDAARATGDTSPLDLARVASRAVLQAGGGRAGRATMAGQHRRPPGQKPEQREGFVDLMKARHVRSA